MAIRKFRILLVLTMMNPLLAWPQTNKKAAQPPAQPARPVAPQPRAMQPQTRPTPQGAYGQRQTPQYQPQRPGMPNSQPRAGASARPMPGNSQPRTLLPAESRQRIDTLNMNRARMSGINSRPLPQGRLTTLSNGHQLIQTADGRRLEVRGNGTVQSVHLPDGREATFRSDGKIQSLRTPSGMTVEHGLHGGRRIQAAGRHDDRIVSEGPHRGYYERPFVRGYYQRTYLVNGRAYARLYRPYSYRGVRYEIYQPVVYYHAAFYSWAERPWPRLVVYSWGPPPPWYAVYGFAPDSEYSSAPVWLTDYLLTADLQAAYDAGRADEANYEGDRAAADPSQPSAQLTPEIKQQIAEEVRQQLAAEQTGAAKPTPPTNDQDESAAPPALDPRESTFVASSTLNVTRVDGEPCELTPGDVISRTTATPDQNNTVLAQVSYSKPQDCAASSLLTISVADLQEMRNSMQAQVDSGLQALAQNQSIGGLATPPDNGTMPGAPAPVPDTRYAQQQIDMQQMAADHAEAQLKQDALAVAAPDIQMMRLVCPDAPANDQAESVMPLTGEKPDRATRYLGAHAVPRLKQTT